MPYFLGIESSEQIFRARAQTTAIVRYLVTLANRATFRLFTIATQYYKA